MSNNNTCSTLPEAEATLTIAEIHLLSKEERLHGLLAWDPHAYPPTFLRAAAKFLRQMAALAEAEICRSEILEGKMQQAQDKAQAAAQAFFGISPEPKTRPLSAVPAPVIPLERPEEPPPAS
jgi:hypothetical protein